MDLFLVPLFSSMGTYVFFMPVSYSFDYWSFVIYFEIRKCDSPQLCSSCSRLLWLFRVSYGSIWILGFYFYFCEEWLWNFDRDFTESVDHFGYYGKFFFFFFTNATFYFLWMKFFFFINLTQLLFISVFLSFLLWISIILHLRQANQMKGNLFCFGILKSTACTHTDQTLQNKVQWEDAERQILYPSLFSES